MQVVDKEIDNRLVIAFVPIEHVIATLTAELVRPGDIDTNDPAARARH